MSAPEPCANIFSAENEFVFVDDDKLTVEIVSWFVHKSRYKSALFTSPREALDYLKASPPKLLLVDFYMPGMTGLEFINELHESTDLSQTKIYLCSAVSPPGDSGELFAALNVGVLEKQVVCDRDQLTRLLDDHLDALPLDNL